MTNLAPTPTLPWPARPSTAGSPSSAPSATTNHVSNVFAKLGVETRAEAVVRARNAGLGG